MYSYKPTLEHCMKYFTVTPTDNPDGRTPFVGEDPLILPLLQRALRSIQRSANLLQRDDVGIVPYGRGEIFVVRSRAIQDVCERAERGNFAPYQLPAAADLPSNSDHPPL